MKALRVVTGFALFLGLAACQQPDEEAGSNQDTGSMVMPDVVGKKLDVALGEIESAGFSDEVEVAGGGALGVVIESRWEVCEQVPAAGDEIGEAPRLTVDRSCDDEGSDDASDTTSSDPDETTSSASAAYSGPEYEIVTIDPEAGMGIVDQYWVYTEKLDYSSDAFKDQVKLLISDVVRTAGTDELIVQVVTDKEIAEAEAVSTYEAFEAEHGSEYAMTVIPEKEKEGWVAWYSGGIDYDSGELSDAETAFTIDWFPASDNPTSEQWRP